MKVMFIFGLVCLLLGLAGIALSRFRLRGEEALMSWVIGASFLILSLVQLLGSLVLRCLA